MAETKASNPGSLALGWLGGISRRAMHGAPHGLATDPMLMGGMKMRAIRSLATVGVIVLAVAATGAADTIADLLTKAQTQDLTAEECGQLSTALKDKTHSAQWGQIAAALKANWARSEIGAWEQVSMVKAVSSGLNALEKSRMASALHSLYAADGPVLTKLDSGESVGLARLLSRVGDKAAAANLLGSWMAAKDEWKTKANYGQLPDLCEALWPGTSKVVAQQKAALTDVVWEKYLKATAPDRSKINIKQLIYIVWIFDVELSEQRLANLGPRLVGWLKTPATVSAAKVQDIHVAKAFLPKFGLMGEYPDIAATWVSASNQWQTLAEWDLVELTAAVGSGKSQLARQQAPKLVALFLSKYFGGTVQPPAAPKAVRMARPVFPVLSLAQRRQVVDKIAPGAGQLQKAEDFINLAHLIKDADRTGNAELVATFATAVVNALKGGMAFPDDQHAYHLRFAFKADAAQQQLRQHVTDAEGVPRFPIGKVLAWAYAYTAKMKPWRAYLDQQVGQATGDKKAYWLLCRAYAEATRAKGYQPLKGKKWADQALAACTTEQAKLRCLEFLAQEHALLTRGQEAASLLDSVKAQFQAQESLTELAAMRERALATAERALAQRQRYEASTKQSARQWHIAELKRRLAVAKAKGKQSAVARYQRLLAQLGES